MHSTRAPAPPASVRRRCGGLPFTTLRGQIEKYAGILQQAKADNNGRLEVVCLKEISRLSGLDRTKTIEEIKKVDRNSKEQLRSQLLGMVERARSYQAGDSAGEAGDKAGLICFNPLPPLLHCPVATAFALARKTRTPLLLLTRSTQLFMTRPSPLLTRQYVSMNVVGGTRKVLNSQTT